MADFNSQGFLQKQFEEEAKPIDKGYKADRSALLMATMAKYNVNQPARLPAPEQGELQSKLMGVKQKWSSKRDALVNKYKSTVTAMQEGDNMAQMGILTVDP